MLRWRMITRAGRIIRYARQWFLKLHAENCGVLQQALMSVRSFSIYGVVAKQRFGRFQLPLWCLGARR